MEDSIKPIAAHSKKPSRIPTRVLPRPSDQAKSEITTNPARNCSKPRTRHTSGREKKGGLLSSSSKENIALAPVKKQLKSNMSYMELKRRHEDLVWEVQALGQRSKDADTQHHEEVSQLAQEIRHFKESNAALRREINSHQAVLDERNQSLDGLQQRLEEIKFENERMAAILEGARLDAVTGEQVEKATNLQGLEQESEFDMQAYEQSLDVFMSGLETTICALQEQREKFGQFSWN